jgi:osmoprotectant transport system permease protein
MGFSNDYVFMMRPEDAERLNIKDLHDLAREADGLKFVMDIEFYDRPERLSVQGIYGLEMKQRRSMEPTLMYGAIENKSADVVIAFRTDGRTVNLMEIEDPLTALPPYDGVLLVSPRLAKSARGMRALRPLIQAIDSQTMRAGNARVEVEKKSIEDTAEWLLDQLFGREE